MKTNKLNQFSFKSEAVWMMMSSLVPVVLGLLFLLVWVIFGG